ncbi:MAG: bifunctional phosphoserine phosphatase/homoserine phosphotransferase ThrH [Spirochaetales bacterium]|nr:bifunctional phosphoserine phosphatase/homoserine phosphotransferase ThrH [Spirochaetales bacterium]
MHLVCLDLEGVLVPEIWIAFSEATGIKELRLTTRDISDYDVLMKRRISILKENGLKLPDIQRVIETMEPLPGAEDFYKKLRAISEVIILSDTFTQFAGPLMKKLANPTLFCNSLDIGDDGTVVGYTLRIKDGKRKAVEAFNTIGFEVVASGDSYNDLSMLKTAARGVLFRPPDSIKDEYPQFPAAYDHDELFTFISAAIKEISGGARKS